MHFFTVRDLRTSPKNVWETLKEEKEVAITNNGKPSALMIPITDLNFEEVLSAVRQAIAARAVSRMQTAALKAGLDKTVLSRPEFPFEPQDIARAYK